MSVDIYLYKVSWKEFTAEWEENKCLVDACEDAKIVFSESRTDINLALETIARIYEAEELSNFTEEVYDSLRILYDEEWGCLGYQEDVFRKLHLRDLHVVAPPELVKKWCDDLFSLDLDYLDKAIIKDTFASGYKVTKRDYVPFRAYTLALRKIYEEGAGLLAGNYIQGVEREPGMTQIPWNPKKLKPL